LNQEAIEQWLIERVSRATGIPQKEIDTQLRMQELGIDSTEAVVISGELQQLCGIPVAPTVLFDYETIGATAEALARRF
jgi:acyl carrier protein